MTKSWLAHACAISPLLFCAAAAHADDASIDVAGPSGRNSAAVFESAYRDRADVKQSGSDALVGQARRDLNVLDLSGVYSPNDRLSFALALPWTNVDTSHRTGLGESAEVSAMLLGDQAATGYKLAGNASISHSPGHYNISSLALMPQYRFDSATLLAGSVALRHQSNAGSSQAATAWLIWRALPQLSVVPELSYAHYNQANGYDAFHTLLFGLSLTEHLDKHWSVSAGAWLNQISTQSPRYFGYVYANGHNAQFNLGLRHTY